MLAFSGIFGLATGMYFVGRSSQFQLMLLFPGWGFSLALVAWTGADPPSARTDRARLRRLLLPGLAALVGFGVMIAAIGGLSPCARSPAAGGRDGADLSPPSAYRGELASRGARPDDRDHPRPSRGGPRGRGERLPDQWGDGADHHREADRAIDQLEDEGGDLVFEGGHLPARGVSRSPSPSSPASCASAATRGRQDPALHLRIWRRRGLSLRLPRWRTHDHGDQPRAGGDEELAAAGAAADLRSSWRPPSCATGASSRSCARR